MSNPMGNSDLTRHLPVTYKTEMGGFSFVPRFVLFWWVVQPPDSGGIYSYYGKIQKDTRKYMIYSI